MTGFEILKLRYSTGTKASPLEREIISDWCLNGSSPDNVTTTDLVAMMVDVDTSFLLEGDEAKAFEAKMFALYEAKGITIQEFESLVERCTWDDGF